MIARLTGKLALKQPDRAIIDVNGVGYLLHIPLSTYYLLPDSNATITLHTYTHVRDDALVLFGFKSLEEKETFELLIGVTKIGPKLALNILSGISVGDFRRAVGEADLDLLNSIPGVGPKTAERISFELRDKLGYPAMEEEMVEGMIALDRTSEEAVSALMNLGYPRPVAEKAMKRASNEMEEGSTLKDLIRGSLKILSG